MLEETIGNLHFTSKGITVQDTTRDEITILVRPQGHHNITHNTYKAILQILKNTPSTNQFISGEVILNSDSYLNGEGEENSLKLEKLTGNALLVSILEHQRNDKKDTTTSYLFYDLNIGEMIEDDMLEYIEKIPTFRHYKITSEQLTQLFNLMVAIKEDNKE